MTSIPVRANRYSIREFPANPAPHELRSTYNELRRTAIGLNISRGQYISKAERLNTKIAELESDLLQFAEAAQFTLQQKAQLDQLLLQYHDVFEGLEIAGDELANAWVSHQGRMWRGTSAILQVIDQVTKFVTAWHKAKQAKKTIEQQANELPSAAES